MEFHPEFAQPNGGSLPSEDYSRIKKQHNDMAQHVAYKTDHYDVSQKHSKVVKEYSQYSKPLNQHLVRRKASVQRNHPSAVEKLDKLHADLTKAIDEAPETHEDLHVYSGISFQHAQKLLSRHREGDTISTKAFTSTSFNPEVAGRFAARGRESTDNRRVILHIHVPKGSKGILHCESASQYPNERESIMKPGTKFRINKVYGSGGHRPDDEGKHQDRRIISVSVVS